MAEYLDLKNFPTSFADEAALEDFMTLPSRALADDLKGLDGDIAVLGVGGKMGPTLARLAKRAAPDKRVIGVARFSEAGMKERLEGYGVETHGADLLDRDEVARLPDAKNVIFMAGRKFGSHGSEELTWAMNVFVPALVAERYKDSRIVVFSTACVYPFVPIASGGAREDVAPVPPPGDYANSCVGRERIFQYFSKKFSTKVCLFRLSYAIDMRYGVLFDVAERVFRGEPVQVSMGSANVIWQGDANSQALRCLTVADSPAVPLNVSGRRPVAIRWLAQEFGKRFGKSPSFSGTEADSAWVMNTDRAAELFGDPMVPMEKMLDWVADWIARGGVSLNKPTGFEVRDGAF